MEVRVLGPVGARHDGHELDLGRPKWRALVAALALSRGRPVSVDGLADLLWGEAPPAGVSGTLQVYVNGLRKALEPDRERRAPAQVLVTVAPGYALRLADGALDAAVFERVVDEQHRRLRLLAAPGGAVLSVEDLGAAVDRLDEALGLWHGTPYGELGDAPAAVAERARLEELRLVAHEDRAAASLALGHHQTVAAALESLTSTHPLRERLWALRALALTRSGRQADALEVLARVRALLDEELGLEPGTELRDLQTAILRQDPALAWTAPPERPTTPVVVTPARPAPEVSLGGAWPLIGRDTDLAALVGALDTAAAGTPSCAVLTGEPGIGKSRLAGELLATARERDARVAVGRCSQDEGAPPLWPWAQVLRDLGAELPAPEGTDEGAEFRVREAIVATVLAAARDRLLVVGLDDLHWADPASLRVLRLLVSSADTGHLLVLATWREHPEPEGALADVVGTMARAHAVRRSLRGLEPDAVAEVFETVSGNRPSPDQAAALRERTDGNPFFLVEYARLAGERSDVAALVADAPPAGVQDVLAQRLGRLPGETVTALRAAAVLGRRFEAPLLARVATIDEDDLLDVIEPAEAAGLVRDDGIERFVFAHALVRDSLLDGLGATRRARLHARAAEALSGDPERRTEQATHWLAAGPAHAARAWRAAVDAAEVTRRLFAHEETARLLVAALASLDDDPEATPTDRYDVLLHLIDAYRWAAMWTELIETVERAVAVAAEIGDVRLVARAAIAPTQGTLWQSAAPGQVHDRIIEALRESLDQLPPGDDALRCRVLLALSNELYYGSSLEERRSLADEALAMARRLGDETLLLDACQISFSSLWYAGTAPERLALADESLALAGRVGNERAAVVSACLRAAVLGELGRPGEMFEAAEVARRQAERLRIPYGLLVIDNLVLPWLAMAGRFDECEATFDRIRAVDAQVSLDQSEAATAGAYIVMASWRGDDGRAAGILASMEGGPFPITAAVVASLWRSGREEEARAHYEAHEIRLDGADWFALFNWGMAAEVALHLGDAALGADAHRRLLPFAGRSCCAGSGNHCGPVDSYLAFAAAATGDLEAAGRHADEGERRCREWGIPLAGHVLRETRTRHGF